MNQIFDPAEVSEYLEVPDGGRILLLDRLGKSAQYSKEELSRNVFRVDKNGRVIWQVSSNFDFEGSPFTRLHTEYHALTAYRWDGGSYVIDMATGVATPGVLER